MSGFKVSLVIPVLNEIESIDRLIDSIEAQRRPPDEVVLVDSASSDGTSERIAAWAARASLAVKHLRLDLPVYPGAGRNRGVLAASQAWIAFTDAGITLDPNWLEELLRAVSETEPVAFGDYDPKLEGRFSEVAAIAYVLPKGESPAGPCRPPFVASMLISRELFERTGGFPEALRSSEDLLFLRHLSSLGVPFIRAPAARVTWSLASDVGATFRRFRKYSRHSVAAGLIDNWQTPVLRRYLGICAVGAMTGIAIGPMAGISVVGGGIAGLLLLRSARACFGHRHDFPAAASEWLIRLPAVAGLLGVIDAAALLGVIDWWRSDRS